MAPASSRLVPAALALFALQFLLASGWTVYVAFLPQLLERVGIAAGWIAAILILDQALFALGDFVAGAAADRSAQSVGRFGRSSMTFLFGIWRGDDLITKGELVYVNADPRSKSSAPWPEDFKAKLVAFERVKPETGGGTPR